MARVLIAMSGGVDSSVAALLMKEQGYDCVGCTMRLFDKTDVSLSTEYSCGSATDADDARAVAERVGIPFRAVDMMDEFRANVVERFIRSYENGITPNPCVVCNKHMKFGNLFRCAEDMGCDYIVTGHYAVVEQDGDRFLLKKGADERKDQSYVLYDLTQEQLAHTIFPLGHLSKNEIRELAENAGFENAHKKDSQDICFIPDGDYVTFLKKERGRSFEPGNFVDMDGNVLGQHKGIECYTIGQHKKLGIALGRKVYVYSINPEDNTVVLCDNEDLFRRDVVASDFNWTSGIIPEEARAEGFRCKAKIRYNHKEQPAIMRLLDNDRVELIFDEPQRAVTPGQSAVVYDGDIVIGGGIIEKQ